MTRNRLLKLALAAVLAVALVGGVAVVVQQTFFRPKTITAYFTKTVAIYPGDEVRIAGVKVGTIDSIEPIGTQAKMTLHVDHGISVPADAKAVIVAQNLISARYVQLAPAYESGPKMSDGAVIPLDRTAIPVEWDEVKEQLMRLATELGPDKGMSTGSVGRFIDSAANALDGNGDKLRQTLAQLSGVGRILADGSGNIVDTITNLQTFVTALRDSNDQIVQFQNRFATLTSVVDDSRSDLDAALKNLSDVVGETQRFIAGTRDKTAEQIRLLAGRHPEPGRPPHGPRKRPAHRAALDRQRRQHVRPAHRCRQRCLRAEQPVESGVGDLHMIGRARERDVARDRKALFAVPSARRCEPLNFNNLPFPFNPFLSSQLRRTTCSIHRGQAQAGERGTAAPAVHRPARGVRVHGCRRCATAAGLWAAARGFAAHGATACSLRPPTLAGHAAAGGGASTAGCRTVDSPPPATGHRRDRDESGRRLLAIGCSVIVTVTGCAFQGVNSLAAAGRGRSWRRRGRLPRRAREYRYARIEFARADRRRRRRQRRQDEVARLAHRSRSYRSSPTSSCPPMPWRPSARRACWDRCTSPSTRRREKRPAVD